VVCRQWCIVVKRLSRVCIELAERRSQFSELFFDSLSHKVVVDYIFEVCRLVMILRDLFMFYR